jgi:dihydrolipoamide dehydrogenase
MTKRVAILGAGPGGYVAAVRAAQLGADVTVIENDQVGGTCLNWGCVPSKILKTTADRLDISRRFGEFGIVTEGEIRLDMETLTERKGRVIQTQRKAIETLFRHNRVRHERGKGRILGYGKIEINRLTGEREILSWDKLLIATGSRTAEISAFPFDGERVISSNEALFLNDIPESIVIVGGGVIGCEFAFIFAGLGSKVTVVEAMGRLLPLPSVDEENSKVLQREMKKRKIDFFVNRTVKGVEYGKSVLRVNIGLSPFTDKIKGKKSLVVEAEKLLVCIGRRPNTDDMGIDTIGVKTDQQGWIQVSNKMTTNIENVYALGDVLGPDKVMMAHVASAEGIVAAENAMGGNRKMKYDVIPGAIFTTPEVAGVGLTEAQALSQGIKIRTDIVLFRNISKAQVLGEIAGQVKMISQRDTGKILGIHIIGPHATDLIAEGALAQSMHTLHLRR